MIPNCKEENGIDLDLLNMFYPVGSYYETSDSTFDPNVKWGGTWEQMYDGTVLISEGVYWNTVAAQPGETIGNVQVWLDINQIPQHAHSISLTTTSSGAHAHSYSGTTSSSGSHNHDIINNATNSNKNTGIATDAGGTGTFGAHITTLNQGDYKFSSSAIKSAGSHTHTYSGNTNNTGSHTHSISGTTGSAGNKNPNPIKLYQPSLVVCRWHRTA